MRQRIYAGLFLAVVLIALLIVPLAAQVDVTNFSNVRTDGFTRADTYVRAGSYVQVGTFLAVTPATAITFTSGTFTPNGSNQKVNITANRYITTIAAASIDGSMLTVHMLTTPTLTFTETTGNLVLGGATRALGQNDRLILQYDTTLAKWYESGFINN
jgi:hypothetical protein